MAMTINPAKKSNVPPQTKSVSPRMRNLLTISPLYQSRTLPTPSLLPRALRPRNGERWRSKRPHSKLPTSKCFKQNGHVRLNHFAEPATRARKRGASACSWTQTPPVAWCATATTSIAPSGEATNQQSKIKSSNLHGVSNDRLRTLKPKSQLSRRIPQLSRRTFKPGSQQSGRPLKRKSKGSMPKSKSSSRRSIRLEVNYALSRAQRERITRSRDNFIFPRTRVGWSSDRSRRRASKRP